MIEVALRLLVFFTLLLGFGYPLFILGVAQMLIPEQANGQLLRRENQQVIGSRLIGQEFTQERYFWPRPSAVAYNPLPSGASNLGPTSAALKAQVEQRRRAYTGEPPAELLCASASGLDPHISPESAQFQFERVALARELNEEGRRKLQYLVNKATTHSQYNLLGEPCVNVLELNLSLDRDL